MLWVQDVYIVGVMHPQYIRTHNTYAPTMHPTIYTHNIYLITHNIYAPTIGNPKYIPTIYTAAPTTVAPNGHPREIYSCTHKIYKWCVYIVGARFFDTLARVLYIVGATVYIVGAVTNILWVQRRYILWTTCCGCKTYILWVHKTYILWVTHNIYVFHPQYIRLAPTTYTYAPTTYMVLSTSVTHNAHRVYCREHVVGNICIYCG